ncbi:sigma-70 family RNA polymerase sigma factor [Rhodoferax ferrireducens]|nr:sigma-70 family RNA polymerase sigma factor [Rhodoferax ferrireducens]
MRARDPDHEQQLKIVHGLDAAELKRRIGIGNHEHANHLASEVLATLIRTRYRETERVVDEAVAELNRRIQILAGKRLRGMSAWGDVVKRGSTMVADTIDYVWESLLADTSPVSNCEVRFAVFVRDRVDDFMRHQLRLKNSMQSVDAMTVTDEQGEDPAIAAEEDTGAETPEEAAIRTQTTARVRVALMALPRKERDAFYFRTECKYEWRKVAELLGCSIPTANQHHQRALTKLLGELE